MSEVSFQSVPVPDRFVPFTQANSEYAVTAAQAKAWKDVRQSAG
jgi:hypothetical protein